MSSCRSSGMGISGPSGKRELGRSPSDAFFLGDRGMANPFGVCFRLVIRLDKETNEIVAIKHVCESG